MSDAKLKMSDTKHVSFNSEMEVRWVYKDKETNESFYENEKMDLGTRLPKPDSSQEESVFIECPTAIISRPGDKDYVELDPELLEYLNSTDFFSPKPDASQEETDSVKCSKDKVK